MSRPVAFGVVLTALLVLSAASAAPSPLYVVFQHDWGFSATVLTLVFAIYAVALLAALLSVGGLSDHVGRRPVLAAALVLDAAAMVVFVLAGGVAALLVARVVQGIATGAALGVLGAYLVDLQHPERPGRGSLSNSIGSTSGLAVGALGSALVCQYAVSPAPVVFGALAVVLVVLAAAVGLLPETVRPRPGALRSLRPRVAVPRRLRPAYLAAVPALVAGWAMGGLYLSLGPSLAIGVLHARAGLVGGAVIATLMATGSLAPAVVREADPATVMTRGALLLAAGTALTLTALDLGSVAGFFAATAVAGGGFGAAFFGALRSLTALAETHERAELFAAIYVVGYLSFSVPAVIAGSLVAWFGLGATATAYACGVVLLALLTWVLGARRGRLQSPRLAMASRCPAQSS